MRILIPRGDWGTSLFLSPVLKAPAYPPNYQGVIPVSVSDRSTLSSTTVLSVGG